MKAPSAVDIAFVMAVFAGVQAAFATIPETQVWWAPALSAGLLAVLKVLQVAFFPGGQAQQPDQPGAGAAASAQLMQQPGKVRQFFTD